MMIPLATVFAAFSTLSFAATGNSTADDFAVYAKLYPAHVEYCAGTTYQKREGVKGGYGGHGFTYVNGLCKDDSKDYPQVKVCDGTEGYPGVGISVNSDFQNVNWVAVPTHSLLMDGDIEDGERITQDTVNRAAEEADTRNIFENVRIKPALALDPVTKKEFTPGTRDYRLAVARNSEGTDIGVRFARNLECVRMPIPSERLSAIAKRLNDINNVYYPNPTNPKGKTYVWNMYKNNCTHVATAILNAAGIRDAIPTEQPMYKSLMNMGIPRNGVYTMLGIGLENRLTNSVKPWAVYDRRADAASVSSDTPWMRAQVGVLAKRYAGFKDNDEYDMSKLAFWIIPRSVPGFAESYAAFSRPESSEIAPNLLSWEKQELGLAEIVHAGYEPLQALGWSVESFGVYDTAGYKAFEPKYAKYVDQQIALIQQNLTEIHVQGLSNLLH